MELKIEFHPSKVFSGHMWLVDVVLDGVGYFPQHRKFCGTALLWRTRNILPVCVLCHQEIMPHLVVALQHHP